MGDLDNDAGSGGQDDKGKGEFRAPATQDEFDRMVADRLTRERSKFADYDAVKAKAAEFDKAQEASKSELQKERDRADAAERERDTERVERQRNAVALAKGLTPSQAKRLVGSTREELEADADELLADLKPPPKKADPKKLASGSSGSGADDGRSRAAAALRQLRSGH